MRLGKALISVVAALAITTQARAQSAPPTPAPVPGPAIGDMAPDFALPGATRYGLLRDQIRLSDFRGRTVVLAFFFQARTKG